MKWLKEFVIGDILGGQVRHVLTGLGGFLVLKEIASPDQAAAFTGSATDILLGLMLYATGGGGSVLNKKIKKG